VGSGSLPDRDGRISPIPIYAIHDSCFEGAKVIDQPINKRDLSFFLAFLLPGLILFAVVIIVPSVLAVQYGLYEASGFAAEATYVGLRNFAEILRSEQFWKALGRTLVYAGASIAGQLVLGIAIALVLNQAFKGNNILRGISVVPYIIPVIAVTIGFEWMLDTSNGIVNHFIAGLGFDRINFFKPEMAMFTAIMLSVWTWTPFVALVFLSGLQTVSAELYESATLDGAGAWTRFWKITVPVTRDIILTIVLLRGLWMFNKFDLIWLLTGGGPLGRTETLPVLIYDVTFKKFQVGYGSALAVISLIIMMVTMAAYLKIFSEKQAKRKFRRRLQRI